MKHTDTFCWSFSPVHFIEACPRQGNMGRAKKFWLDKEPYPAGGYRLTIEDTGLLRVYGGFQIIDKFPNGEKVEPAGYQAELEITVDCQAILRLWCAGAEVIPGTTFPAGSYIGLMFEGTL